MCACERPPQKHSPKPANDDTANRHRWRDYDGDLIISLTPSSIHPSKTNHHNYGLSEAGVLEAIQCQPEYTSPIILPNRSPLSRSFRNQPFLRGQPSFKGSSLQSPFCHYFALAQGLLRFIKAGNFLGF